MTFDEFMDRVRSEVRKGVKEWLARWKLQLEAKSLEAMPAKDLLTRLTRDVGGAVWVEPEWEVDEADREQAYAEAVEIAWPSEIAKLELSPTTILVGRIRQGGEPLRKFELLPETIRMLMPEWRGFVFFLAEDEDPKDAFETLSPEARAELRRAFEMSEISKGDKLQHAIERYIEVCTSEKTDVDDMIEAVGDILENAINEYGYYPDDLGRDVVETARKTKAKSRPVKVKVDRIETESRKPEVDELRRALDVLDKKGIS